MKNTIKLAILMLFSIAVSCKKTESEDPNNKQKNTDSITQKKESVLYNYVNCKTGLQYRIAPEGKIIGRFPYNTQLEILKKTGITGFIEEEVDFFPGEWTGVRYRNDTVYVIDACLTNSYDVSLIKASNEYYLEPEDVVGKELYLYQKDTIVIAANTNITVEAVTQKEFESLYETLYEWQEIDRITKKNGVISITCANQKTIRFKDKQNASNQENQIYTYQGKLGGARSHLVSAKNAAGDSYYLVDMVNCDQQKLSGFPLFNTDFSFLFSINKNNSNYSEIGIHTLERNEWNLHGAFKVPFKISRSVFDIKNNLYIENYVEWNDGTYQKRSWQYFKIMIKGISTQ
ncbi:hypothetical protein [Ascidiimonas sp. W6]|uniref:hypothetical protein n=1 Tax=Ascidiimonas meishanensis TaxID=3128903 RepID=UPI0030ED03D8